MSEPRDYPTQLLEEIGQIRKKYPFMSDILDVVYKQNARSSMEFDYDVERIAAIYREINEILDKFEIKKKKIDSRTPEQIGYE